MIQAVILAGGLGIRLRPVLNDLPKPLAPVLGRPFLEYQLLTLKRQAITQLVICASYQSDKIKDYFGDGSRWGLEIRYSVEPTPLGTAGALAHAGSLLQDEFLVLNGDTYVDIDYRALVQRHGQAHADATIAITRSAETDRYGSLILDQEYWIISFAEKTDKQRFGTAGWINAGVYILSREIINYIPCNQPTSIEYETFPTLIREGKAVYGFPVSGYFIDIGTPNNYARFIEDVKEGRIHVHS